jgi:hypothetical protein
MSTPSERSQQASIAALTRHALHDPKEATAAARAKWLDGLRVAVDPDGSLEEEERARRAHRLLKARMKALALKSAKARAAKAGGGGRV